MQKKSSQKSLKNHRTIQACFSCRKAHIACGEERPCQRCKKKGTENTCFNAPPKKRGRKIQPLPPQDLVPMNPILSMPQDIFSGISFNSLPDPDPEILSEVFLSNPGDNFNLSYVGFESESTEEKDKKLKRCLEYLQKKLDLKDEELEEIKKNCTNRMKLKEKLTCEILLSMAQDFNTNLRAWKETFTSVQIPTEIWGRGGMIHWVNEAFILLTGFNLSLPTKFGDNSIPESLSPEGCRKYLECFFSTDMNSFIFPTGILSYKTSTPDKPIFINGVCSITAKRDNFGIPLILLVNFLPILS